MSLAFPVRPCSSSHRDNKHANKAIEYDHPSCRCLCLRRCSLILAQYQITYSGKFFYTFTCSTVACMAENLCYESRVFWAASEVRCQPVVSGWESSQTYITCRSQRKIVHASMHTAALIAVILGLVATFKSHTLKLPTPTPNLYRHGFLLAFKTGCCPSNFSSAKIYRNWMHEACLLECKRRSVLQSAICQPH